MGNSDQKWGASLMNPTAVMSTGGQMYGQMVQNEANASAADKANAWQGDQIRSGREFEERMSNTAHQRETKDLEAAGLNRILSLASSGASTPSAGGGTPAVPHMENVVSPAIATAMEMSRMKQDFAKSNKEIGLLDAQIKKTNVDAAVASKGIPEAEIRSGVFNAFGRPILNKLKEIGETNSRFRQFEQDSKKQELFDAEKELQDKHPAFKLKTP